MRLGADLKTAREESGERGRRGVTAKADNLVVSRAVTPLMVHPKPRLFHSRSLLKPELLASSLQLTQQSP